MPALVHARCPSCKHTLRIPADWIDSALKCKHCGTFFRARDRAGPDLSDKAREKVAAAPAIRPSRNGSAKEAVAAYDIAAQRSPAAAQIDQGLAGLDDVLKPSEIGKGARTRRGPSIPVVPILVGVGLFFVLVAALVAALIILPKLKPRERVPTAGSGIEGEGSSSDSKGPGRKRPHRSGRTTPIDQRTALKGEFPNRRALVISVNNYLYLNPTLYGATKGDQPRNVGTLMERFRTGLRIPRDQMAQVSDAAPANAIKPTKKAIEDAIAQLLTGAREQDCLLLMFAGHVVEASPAEGQPDEACLVPLEGVPNQGETLIPISALLHQLELSPARQKVLILDVCSLNPARGLEFPGSGPPDADAPGAMWEKLDKQLAQTPEGVQVFLSCLKDQFSYELELDFNNSVFLHALDVALMKIVEDKIQYPEEPMPLQELVDLVNETMKETLSKYTSSKEKRTQVARLSGTFYEGGLTFDAAEAPLPRLTVTDPVVQGGAARLEDLRQILTELKAPPIRSSNKNASRDPVPPLDVKILPFIAADDLKEYVADDRTPEAYKKAVEKARDDLKNLPLLDEELLALVPPKTDRQYDDEILGRQRAIAHRQTLLKKLLDEMTGEDGKSRNEASKRWRANFDYVKTRALAQLAYSYEVNSALGAARKKETPPIDKALQQNGWRMAANVKPQGDKEGKDVAKARVKLLRAMEEDYKGTPWEVVARREEFAALGVEWQPAQLGK